MTHLYDWWEPGPVEQAVDRFSLKHLRPNKQKKEMLAYSIHRLEFSDIVDLVQQLSDHANDGWEVVQVLTTESIAKGHGDAIVLFKRHYDGVTKP